MGLDVRAWLDQCLDVAQAGGGSIPPAPGLGPVSWQLALAELKSALSEDGGLLPAVLLPAEDDPGTRVTDAMARDLLATFAASGVRLSKSIETPAAPNDHSAELELLASDPELATMFVTEALDHLASVEATLLELEANPDDLKLLNDIFRPFHTIKGNAGALGVTRLQAFAHSVENLLDQARCGKHAFGPTEVELVLQSVDLASAMIRDLGPRLAGDAVPDRDNTRLSLMRWVSDILAGSDVSAPAVETAPVATTGRDEPVSAASPRVTAPNATAPQGPSRPSAESSPPETRSRAGDLTEAAVKVDTRKLDNLVDMVGELVIAQSLVSGAPALLRVEDDHLSRNLSQLLRITSELQRSAMSLRMVPIRQSFQKMARLVRDLGKKTNKDIELVLSGEETELDRKLVEDIQDPLMHMVRNSIDHGIESAEQRARSGKPARGRLALSACHQSGQIVIAISDDGAGLDEERILAKAVAQGIVPPGETLSKSEIHQLVFRPGFSTAKEITEISGRGVGMDVVRRNIDALRGRIEIQSTPGQGTTFLIKLPLTLAIVDGLLLRVGSERFVLPTTCVRESLRPSREQIHSIAGGGSVLQVRDALLSLVSLAEVFGIPGDGAPPWERTVVVAEDDGHCFAMFVDELLGKQEVVIKSLGPVLAGARGIAGGAILGDGRIGLILDPRGIMRRGNTPLVAAA